MAAHSDAELEQRAMADLELDLDLIADNEEDYAAGCLVGSPPAKSSEKRPVSARRGRGGGRAGAARRGSKAPKLVFFYLEPVPAVLPLPLQSLQRSMRTWMGNAGHGVPKVTWASSTLL